MDTEDTNVVGAIRRANAEMPINLSHRRNWYDDKSDATDTTDTSTTPEPGKDANTGASNTGEETPPTLPKTQKDLDGMFADRAGRAKRNALSDLAKSLEIGDVTELGEIVKSHKQAEEKRKEDEEAAKSELQKLQDNVDSSVALQTTLKQDNSDLLIKVAVMETAPGKGVQPAYFADLLTLMDRSKIEIKDGIVDIKTVEAAIDATLEGRDYLKTSGTNNGQGYGSPSRKSPTQANAQETQKPVKRERMKW